MHDRSTAHGALMLFFPAVGETAKLAALVAGHLLAEGGRARLLPGEAATAQDLLAQQCLLLVQDHSEAAQAEAKRAAARWQRILFTSWSPQPLTGLRFVQITTSNQADDQLAALLRYYGSLQLAEPQRWDRRAGHPAHIASLLLRGDRPGLSPADRHASCDSYQRGRRFARC